jgi:RNA-directed DNA polymerase
VVRQLTAKDRLARSLKAINQRCKRMRHWPLRQQHQRLCRVLESGALSGVREHGLVVYKGVPFATAPLGDLRWRDPQPVVSWVGKRDKPFAAK